MTQQSLTRNAVRIASAIAPRTVGRAVFWRSCRTPLPARSTGATVAMAERRLSSASRAAVSFKSGSVETYTFPPAPGTAERGTVALIHGWTGRAAFMTAFVAPLTAEGFKVVAVDLPGHGASPGRLLHMPLAVEALHAVHRASGPWFGIAAHSFGGLVAMALASGRVAHVAPVPVERMVLLAAPHDARFVFEYVGGTAGLGSRAQAAMNEMALEVAGRPIGDFDGVSMLRKAGARTLVLHAPDDREVPFACAEALRETGDIVTLAPVPGAGHRRILYAPAAVELVAAFMTAPGRSARHAAE